MYYKNIKVLKKCKYYELHVYKMVKNNICKIQLFRFLSFNIFESALI